MSGNITRAEAAARSGLVSAESYEIELDLTTGPERFRSTTTVRFTSNRPGEPTWLDLIAPEVTSLTVNGMRADPATHFDGSRITIPDPAEHNEVVVVAECAYMHTGEGLHRFTDPVDDEVYLYSQFETADSRRMYACFEQPDLKARFSLAVRAPGHWQVISNSPVDSVSDDGPDGARTWRFAATPVVSTYITALVAGPYHRVTDEYEGQFGRIPLGLYCRASLAEHLDADAILHLTKQGFAFFEGIFGLAYPFEKYDQLFVPDFNAGAMENAGCVTFREDYVFRSRVTRAAYETRANTILHEMAHMWFGDLVTMKWWDDLWLNESFAEWAAHYASAEATEFTDAWTSFANGRKAWAYRQDQLPSTHPIAADMVDLDAVQVNFDGITYAKGASALKQLVAWVGGEHFLAGLRGYFAEFAWGNTELGDLLGHLERASGRELGGWAQQWLQTSGVNLLRPEIVDGPDGTIESLAVIQEPPATPAGLPPVLRDHRLRIGLFSLVDGRLERTGSVDLDVTGERTEVPELAGARRPDLLLLNDADLTYAKVRLDPASTESAVAHLAGLSDSLARSLIWGAAWDMTRDAEMSTAQFVDLAISGLPGESEISVLQNVLRQALTAIDAYAAPDRREGYRQRLAAACRGWAQSAEPGSDRQLACVRALISLATTPEDVALLAGILSGEAALPGLVVDTDLRWSLLQRLVAVGRAGTDQIEAEYAADPTATGKRQRAVALAGRPDPEAKEQAWTVAVDTDELPNSLLVATMAGWAQPEQADLLRPYRDRYFASLPTVWEQRTSDMAATISQYLFPYFLVEEETLAAADAFLAGPQHPSAARFVAEGRDTVARSLRAQEFDARG